MSIPYNDNLSWVNYLSNPDWQDRAITPIKAVDSQTKRAAKAAFNLGLVEPFTRSVQFFRDSLRLTLKVPLRALKTPYHLEKNWKEYERAKINVKLTAYSFVHVLTVPAKFGVALTALALSAVSAKRARQLLDSIDSCTSTLDGRASQLEALKEEGVVNATDKEALKTYQTWLYSLDPKLCRKL
jgi:hypothetical protein